MQSRGDAATVKRCHHSVAKRKKLEPLVPYYKRLARLGYMGVVTLRIPAGTDPKIARGAQIHARNKAAKINRSHEKDHYYEKGWK